MTSGIYFYYLCIIWTLNNHHSAYALMYKGSFTLSKKAQALNICLSSKNSVLLHIIKISKKKSKHIKKCSFYSHLILYHNCFFNDNKPKFIYSYNVDNSLTIYCLYMKLKLNMAT